MSTDFCYYEGNLEFIIPIGKYDSLIKDLKILCEGHWSLKSKREQLKANFSDEFKASKLYDHELLFRQYHQHHICCSYKHKLFYLESHRLQV